MAKFMECTSLNINFNVHGVATVSYTIVSDISGIQHLGNSLSVGGQIFTGYITNIYTNRIPNTNRWYESHVTMVAETS